MLKTRIQRAGRRLYALGVCFTAVVAAGAFHTLSDTPVADAVMKGDSAQLRLLIKQGLDVNSAQADGMTALHWAASRGDTSAVRMLVAAGARTESHTRNGNYTPLHMAARAGKANAARALLTAGANVNAFTNTGGATALHFASNNGDAATVTALLDKGAAINAPDSANALTPLMWAAAANRLDAVKVLVKRGANLELESRIENIPAVEKADRAAAALRTRRVAALKNAENPPPTIAAGTPRGAAGGEAAAPTRAAAPATSAPAASAPAASSAPAPGAPAAATTPVGASAPAPAAKAPAPAVVSSGPEAGKPGAPKPEAGKAEVPVPRAGRGPSYTDLIGMKGGLTALLFAARDGHVEVARALLAGGAKVNHVSGGDHSTPLLLATINGNFDLAKVLLDAGADVKLASDANNTPLYAAINVQWSPRTGYPAPVAQGQQTLNYLDYMELLLKAGADPNVRLSKHLWYMSYNFDQLGVNTAGATPFWRAAYGTDVPAMKLLVKYGADVKTPTYKPSGVLPGAEVQDDAGGKDLSGLPPVPDGGPGAYPIHAASGVGFSEGFAGNAHRHAPDGWLPSLKYLIEEQHADVNARDFNGYTALHHAATRGDNEAIKYLISKGADINVISRRGQTATDMANGPVQRVPPFLETVAYLESLGVKNNHKCKSC